MNAKNYNFNFLEKELFNYFGVKNPTNTQFNLMRRLVGQISINKQLLFDDCLTQQERGCLFYAAHGYSVKETAEFLGCAERTTKYYRKEILRKLECVNMAQAVFIGIRYNYLHLQNCE
jgi:DNA-binding CsgD family transcriptional regulator